MKRAEFHNLFIKFLPCSNLLSEYNISEPAGAISNKPTLTASEPYFSIRSRGSAEFPNDLLIFLPSASLTIPLK